MDFSLLASETIRAILPNASMFSVSSAVTAQTSDRWAGFVPAEVLVELEEQYWEAYAERDTYLETNPVGDPDRSLVARVIGHPASRS